MLPNTNQIWSRLRRGTAAVLAASVVLVLVQAPAGSESFEEKISALERKAAGNVAEKRAVEQRLEEARDKRAQLEAQIADAEARRSGAAAELREIAVAAYKTGGDSYLQLVITGAENAEELAKRVGYTNHLMRHKRRQAYAARDAGEDAQAALEELAGVETDEKEALERLEAAESEIEAALAEQRRLYEESKKPPPPPPEPKKPAQNAQPAPASQESESAASSAPGDSGGDAIDAHLARIRQCESGGNYRSISASGTYTGAYQFSDATWHAMGGSGRAMDASPAEQDMRARALYERSGPGQWPNCS